MTDIDSLLQSAGGPRPKDDLVERDMVYVAADPEQPGAAYAIVVDDGKEVVQMHELLVEWAKEGAIPMRVTRAEGLSMLNKWERPQRSLKL